MSDHLASLAARAIGRPAVRPLVPTLFGHTVDRAEGALMEREELVFSGAPPAPPRAKVAESSGGRMDAARPRERDDATRQVAHARAIDTPEAPRGDVERRVIATPPEHQPLRLRSEHLRAAPETPVRSAAPLPPTAPLAERILVTREMVQVAAAVPRERGARPTAPPTTTHGVATPTLVAPAPIRADAQRARHDPAPVQPALPVRARRELRSAQAPDIHITIGRVDVRAVPAPASTSRTPAPPSRPQPLALNAYLSQRQGRQP